MNIRHIRRAVGLVARSSVSELHFEDALGMTLIVRNRPQSGFAAWAPAPNPSAAEAVEAVVAGTTAGRVDATVSTSSTPSIRQDGAASMRIVTSPMVGRFYRGARRDGKPLVRVGEKVEAGQALASIEMMRLMYSIRSDCAGTVEAVLVEDGEAVEYGQPLVRIA